jgi:glycosyltransferase involved in cell wall biosynthesis
MSGHFLLQRQTGVQRYTLEMIKSIDKILDNASININIELLVPSNAENIPALKQVKTVICGKSIINPRVWLQTYYAYYVKKNKAVSVLMSNEIVNHYRKSIVVLYDVNVMTYSQKEAALLRYYYYYYYCAQIKKYAAHIITISESAKYDIFCRLGVEPERITVIYPAHDHVINEAQIEDRSNNACDNAVMEKYSISIGGYYFCTASPFNRNKNFKWVLETAKKNPNAIFIIAGRNTPKIGESNQIPKKIPENVTLVGYVNDSEMASLIKGCKAFLFPSIVEGFGMPPLEALALGVPVIISDIAVHREVYGNSAHYINPLKFDYDIDNLLSEPVASADECLNKYSWDASARKMIRVLEKYYE